MLADFDNKQVEHYGQKAYFFIKDGRYQVTISYDDNTDTYPIKYTFGHFSLQQYLVATEQGKLQVLPFAWDSRNKAEGGQRWYHNYSHELINNLFTHPYTKVEFITQDLNVHRNTASKYLNQLVEIGLLSKHKLGKDNYYLSSEFYELLSN
ncbi:MAG: hypothetical protein HRT54_20025 [Colwellia sp.]|nr:hypothetical protein [Colwellia sp.]